MTITGQAKNEYEDYDGTSQQYDDTRVPVGVDIIERNLRLLGNLSKLTVLDGGCGTGNYIGALQGKVGKVHGLEVNSGMLRQAKQKLGEYGNVELQQGSLDEIPYRDQSVDAVIINQVLHHLNGTVPDALREIHRVLRDRGLLLINTSTREQQRDGFWWASLIPIAVEKISQRFPTLEGLETQLRDTGFEVGRRQICYDPLQGDGYFNPKGPFEKSYRDGDSTWSLAGEKELAAGLQQLQRLGDGPTLYDFLRDRDKLREQVGQSIFVTARRNGDKIWEK